MLQIYQKQVPGYEDRVTLPVLWDKEKGQIVNNESSEIMRILNSEFNSLATNPNLELFPAELESQIMETNEWVYNQIDNGVYKCGFAQSQEAYDESMDLLFSGLQKAEEMLEGRNYLVGEKMSFVDLRLFMTLIRFDPVYVVYFKTNLKMIKEFKNLSKFVKHLYHDLGLK